MLEGTKDDIACPEGWRWKDDWIVNKGKKGKSKNDEGIMGSLYSL